MVSEFQTNRLKINIEKTSYMFFTKLKKAKEFLKNITIKIDNTIIHPTTNFKYLGVWIDDKFFWDFHVDFLHKKLIKYIPLFYRMRKHVPMKVSRNLYYAFIYPHFVYAVELLHGRGRVA